VNGGKLAGKVVRRGRGRKRHWATGIQGTLGTPVLSGPHSSRCSSGHAMRACVMSARAHEQVQVPRRRTIAFGYRPLPTVRHGLCLQRLAVLHHDHSVQIPSGLRTERIRANRQAREAADARNKHTNGSYSPSVFPPTTPSLPPAALCASKRAVPHMQLRHVHARAHMAGPLGAGANGTPGSFSCHVCTGTGAHPCRICAARSVRT
jgi:hypothetical protein